MKRNFMRWRKQYEASKTDGDMEAMEKLMKWLEERLPEKEMCTIAHGDFRYICIHGKSQIKVDWFIISQLNKLELNVHFRKK